MIDASLRSVIDKQLERTRGAQAVASDPATSAWVRANAGTGKTHVLTMRVLRLLLAGTRPERILCLTYTKAAAAEMSTRIFGTLGKWVTMPETTLERTLAEIVGRPPDERERELARTLFTRAIETPGGFKVQTIHAFCERLLQRFPLEAGVPADFNILDEAMAAALRREAIDHVLEEATRTPASALGQALLTTVTHAADQRFDDLLAAALTKRDWLEAATRIGLGQTDDELAGAAAIIRRALGVADGVSRKTIDEELAGVLPDADLVRGSELLARGRKTDIATADNLRAALRASTTETRIGALRAAFLTKDDEPRADRSFVTRDMQVEHPDLFERLAAARGEFARLFAVRRALDVAEATVALLRLACAVLQRYAMVKARRAALDFDDLIAKTAILLNPSRFGGASSAAEWVLYKLDGGLEHVLVDESQDTSPAQWRIIESLAQEFFAGAGAREGVRTLFAVGDEKQSIYSFQGAAPEQFAAKGVSFEEAARHANIAFEQVPLDVSFRSVAPILAAVDGVFADHAATPGLTSDPRPITHEANRIGQAGLVEIWPTEVPGDAAATDVWQPLQETSDPAPVARLANRIADTIDGWLTSGERLESEGRPIAPGDILILLRRRRPFAPAMLAALKARRIPVAGADRMRLMEQPAVADLVALGDFLTLPEDELALATVLKSPLFGFDDDDLLAIGYGRKGSLWPALIAARELVPRYRAAQETLKRWRAKADYAPPFEFLSSLLEHDAMRPRLLERLGAEAADAIDELLNLAIAYDESAPPSLSGFLAWLRAGEREIKRDMEHGRNEVRIMTVHGAKGLEAPIVLLADTCSPTTGNRSGLKLPPLSQARLPLGVAPPFVWPTKGAGTIEAVAGAQAEVSMREREEHNRLLYVAMTRARDRLYVTGFEGKNGRAPGCWYDLVRTALEPGMSERILPDGRRILTSHAPQTADVQPSTSAAKEALTATTRPDWASRAAPREPQLAIPLAPSRLAPYEVDEAGDPLATEGPSAVPKEPPAPRPAALVHENRFLRGTISHALLQHLPAFAPAERKKAAAAFVALRGAALPERVRREISEETLSILSDPAFAPLFGPESRAEVPIVATIPRPSGHGPALRIVGQIDRLALLEGEVLIIDYKTNRPPPRHAEDVAEAYLLQLAAYRLALAHIFPEREVKAAILWTGGPSIMPFSGDVLDRFAARLWDLPAAPAP